MKRFFSLLVLAIIWLPFFTSLNAQGLFHKITHPDAIGGSFVATHLDGLVKSSSAGPGLELFLKYNLSPQFFLSVGTGVSMIYDDMLTSDNFKETLFPTFELKGGYSLLKGQKFSPVVFAGVQGFGWTVSVGGATSDRYYDGAVFGGAGFDFHLSEKVTFNFSGDYRYIFTVEGDPKPKHWTAKAGITYALMPGAGKAREAIEYPLGEGDIALDDLFTDDLGGDAEEEDALALLFQPEEESGTDASESATYPLDSFSEDSYSSDTEVGRLMTRIQELKDEMAKRDQQIDDLQQQIRANEKAIAEVTGHVAGDYAGVSGGSFGVRNAETYKQAYENALQLFYAKQYQNAIRNFNSLLTSNPDHRLASNCQYWIGESYNAMGDYTRAIDSFNAVMRYQSSYKFDDALLMSGLCYLKLGDRATARENFQQLVSRFPDSEYAPKAMRYLGRL